MANKVGLHVNTWTGTATATIRASPPNCLKILSTAVNHDELKRWRDQRPFGDLIYREFIADDRLDNVQARCDQLLLHVNLIRDLVNFVETPWNEQHQGNNDFADLDAYTDATIKAVDILHADGLRVLVGHFGVGNPADIAGDWPHFHPAIRAADGLSLHEYSAPTMQDVVDFRCLRYRKVYAQLPLDCRKSLYISECGIDTGVIHPDGRDHGWRSQQGTTADAYVSQLRWYAQEIAKDSYVKGATIFACGTFADGNPIFTSFDVAGVPEIQSFLKEDFPQPDGGGHNVNAQFTLGFATFHHADPVLIGDPLENAWGSATGNVHQGTTGGELLWHKAADRMYFADKAGILWEFGPAGVKQVHP